MKSHKQTKQRREEADKAYSAFIESETKILFDEIVKNKKNESLQAQIDQINKA